VVILGEEQADLAGNIRTRANIGVLVQRITFKQLQRKLDELLAVPVEK
jgi:hypothetical protein